MRRYPIAVIQMASGQDPEENLQTLSAFVREAAQRGARAAPVLRFRELSPKRKPQAQIRLTVPAQVPNHFFKQRS